MTRTNTNQYHISDPNGESHIIEFKADAHAEAVDVLDDWRKKELQRQRDRGCEITSELVTFVRACTLRDAAGREIDIPREYDDSFDRYAADMCE